MDYVTKNKQRTIRIPDGFDCEKYEADGVDIGLLLGSLNRSPTERAESNKSMISFFEEAQKAREKIRHAHLRP
jgi:hypothetical protein